jgi:NTP pyrophosphatase (non-canonical NTP hydrolase)
MLGEEICLAAIDLYGRERQEQLCIEECAELIQAINKKHRGKQHNIPEEIADVEIMLYQVKEINGCAEEVERIKKEKLERLAAKMSGGRI